MDSYQQPHHHYMRPPPPPPPPQAPPQMTADPHFPHHHHHPQLPPPPPPPSNSWYPNQFQYHPSPPPQQQNHNQWGPPPPPPQQQQPPPPYPTHPHQAYPAQPYPPPPPPPPRPSQQQPPLPPPPPYPAHPPQNQDWTNANWGHQSAWEYPAPVHGNEEDWAAKAKAWASARSASENQYPQAQFTPVAPQEEPSYYANQYAQPVEPHYQDVQQTSIPTSGYQNYQAQFAPSSRPPMMHQQEPAYISSYAPDAHFPYAANDGAAGGDTSTAFPHHQASPSSFVHQQEVPSSYSSVPGMEDGSQRQHHGHSLLPADGRSLPTNHAQFAYGNHPPDPMDQPLDFIPKFSHENDPQMNSSYPDSSGPVRGIDSVSAVSSLQSWTAQVAPGESYPPMNPAFPSAPQHDPSIGLPPLPGQPVSMFGRGPSFQSVPSTAAGLGTGSSLHPTAAFPTDAYGASLISERPKKAAVPNWLREEIIKNKATITTSAPEPLNDESQSNEDEIIVKSAAKGDQADSKSMDSARSTEEEDDDDEDYEAQKTAAINQEIKRVLTEVLLKVTDDLFDEIATKVISEDDLADEATEKSENHAPALKSSPTRPPAPALTASAKILVPVKEKESEGHASGESSSGILGAGNVLGLANYASDDDDEIQTSGVSKSDSAAVNGATQNGHRNLEAEDRRNTVVTADADHSNGNSTEAEGDRILPVSKLHDHRLTKDLNSEVEQASSRSSTVLSKNDDGIVGGEQSVIKSDVAKSIVNDRKSAFSQPDGPIDKENVKKSSKDDSQERDSKRRDRHESKRSSSGRDNYKEVESDRKREAEKEETRSRRDEKRLKKDKTEDHNISREKSKEQDSKHVEKVRELDSRRSPHHEDRDRKKERERDKKRSGKDDADKKRERTKDEKGDRSRHKSSSDASKHKRRRSSSDGSRGRKNEESAAGPDGSDDETSDDSKRKVHSKRRNLSPSPVRSRRRQVSRSPHSKHSQRRHSPYSSLDDSRGRRSKSRSKSPVRRRK